MLRRPASLGIWYGTALMLALGAGSGAFAKKKPLKAHVHGAAKLNAAIQEKTLILDLEVPADAIFGFEHKPTTDADKTTAAAALKLLQEKPLELFVLDASLGCKVTKAEATAHYGAQHADIEGTYLLDCLKPLQDQRLKLGLFKAFPRLKSVQVQVVSESGQKGFRVASEKDEIGL